MSDLNRTATNAILTDAGLQPLPTGQLSRFEERRGSLESAQQEIDGYPWPCLVQNDRSEIVLWNPPAVRVAELDFGRELPELRQRHLMRIAAMPHFRERVQNWSEVVGAMIGIFKGTPAMDIGDQSGLSPYYMTLVTELMQQHPLVLAEMLALWQQKPAWTEAVRLVFPADWRLADGTELQFDCVHAPWSLFDSTSTIDWFPADGATCDWLQTATPGDAAAMQAGKTIPRTPWHELLRMGREGSGLSQKAVAETAGVSVEALKKYEQGLRQRPARQIVLRLAWAMELDGATTNAILVGLGYDPEPSEWSQRVAGAPASTHFYDELSFPDRAQRSRQRMDEHVAGYRWPCLLISEECRLAAVNPAMTELLGSALPVNGRGRTLLHLLLDQRLRRAMLNWEEVLTAILPANLRRALVSGDVTAIPVWLREALVDLHRDEPALLPRLQEVLRTAAAPTSDSRIIVPLYWRTDDDRLLSFTCVLSLWSGSDTIWALDWHPADGET